MSNKTICVNGDSFTHEYHLDTVQRWSNIIGANYNLSIGAGSNDRIFNTTIEFLNHNTIDIMIIGWTHWGRTFLPASNGSRYVICGESAFEEDCGIDSNNKEILKFYYNNLYNEFTQFKNTLEYMLHLQDYCKLKKIKLLYFSSIFDDTNISDRSLHDIANFAYMVRDTKELEQNGIKHNIELLKKLTSKLDINIWVNNHLFFSMNKYLKNFPRVSDTDGHVGSAGSAHWAELIKQHI
jgi:hypothetical protein